MTTIKNVGTKQDTFYILRLCDFASGYFHAKSQSRKVPQDKIFKSKCFLGLLEQTLR